MPCLPCEQPSRRTDYYKTKGLDVECKFLPLSNVKDHQLKGAILLGNGNFAVKPHIWKAEHGPAVC